MSPPVSGEVSREAAEKVLAAAVAKSEELGVKVLLLNSTAMHSTAL
jgi:hypothetical protein